jgi:copper chaperone CopZ
MLVLIVISIPMYVCATASIPIAVSLMLKGFSPGVAFVFLAAGPATNAASLSMIAKVLGKKTTAAYVLMIAFLSIMFGLLLDWIFSLLAVDPLSQISAGAHQMQHFSPFQWIVSGIFLILLMMSVYRRFIQPRINRDKIVFGKKQKILIEGMTCNHCVMNVRKAIEATPGVDTVEVVLPDNLAYVEGDYNFDELKKNVEEMGYKVIDE